MYIIVLLTKILQWVTFWQNFFRKLKNFMWLVLNGHPKMYFIFHKYILSVKSFVLKIFCGLKFLKNEVIGRRLKASRTIPNEYTHKPDNGTKSMKKCSHLLFEKATPKTWDQNLFAVTMEYVSSGCVGEKALKVEYELPSWYIVLTTVAPWIADKSALPKIPATPIMWKGLSVQLWNPCRNNKKPKNSG